MANVLYTASAIKARFAQVAAPIGLSAAQFNILRILRGAGDWLSMNEVKDRMIEKSPNATRLCDKLLNKDLIERRRSAADRRVVHLKLSKEGYALLQKADKLDHSPLTDMQNNLTLEEAKTVSTLLDKLRG